MTLKEEIIRGEQAKQVLESPMFKSAIDSVRSGLVKAMEQSGFGDATTHNRLVIALQLLNQIEKSLISHIDTGKMAVIQTDEAIGTKIRRLVGS